MKKSVLSVLVLVLIVSGILLSSLGVVSASTGTCGSSCSDNDYDLSYSCCSGGISKSSCDYEQPSGGVCTNCVCTITCNSGLNPANCGDFANGGRYGYQGGGCSETAPTCTDTQNYACGQSFSKSNCAGSCSGIGTRDCCVSVYDGWMTHARFYYNNPTCTGSPDSEYWTCHFEKLSPTCDYSHGGGNKGAGFPTYEMHYSTDERCELNPCVPVASTYQITSAKFKNLRGDELTTSADSGDTILLEVGGINFTQASSSMNYSIKNKTDKWIFSTLSLVDSDTLSSIFWKITAGVNDRINFTASLGTKQNSSGNLDIATFSNSLPVAKIDSPANNTEIFVGTIVSLTQSSYDADDLLNLTWDFGDGSSQVKISNYYSVFSSAGNTQHNFSTNGTFVVKLNASEMSRNQSALNSVTIIVKRNVTIPIVPATSCSSYNTSAACIADSAKVANVSVNNSATCGRTSQTSLLCSDTPKCSCYWNGTACFGNKTILRNCDGGIVVSPGECLGVGSEILNALCEDVNKPITAIFRYVYHNGTISDPVFEAECVDISKSYPCVSLEKLGFFSSFSFIVSGFAIALAYFFFSLKNKKNA